MKTKAYYSKIQRENYNEYKIRSVQRQWGNFVYFIGLFIACEEFIFKATINIALG